jgi:hypothetical protein
VRYLFGGTNRAMDHGIVFFVRWQRVPSGKTIALKMVMQIFA